MSPRGRAAVRASRILRSDLGAILSHTLSWAPGRKPGPATRDRVTSLATGRFCAFTGRASLYPKGRAARGRAAHEEVHPVSLSLAIELFRYHAWANRRLIDFCA